MVLRKEKREYFANLNEKDIIYNKKFWHTVKLFLSHKIKSRKNIILLNNEKITSNEGEVTNTFNNFFSWIIKNFKIPECCVEQNVSHSLSRYPTFKAIPKYKNHPSINSNKSFSQRFSNFYFLQVDKNTVLKKNQKMKFK